MSAPSPLPAGVSGSIEIFALGGTIASQPQNDGEGVSPSVTVDDLVAAVPGLGEVARIDATQVLQVPSCEVTPDDLVLLVELMRAAVDAGADGCVVTQGTDTLEETAFVLDLLWDRPQPVVVTGAMRSADAPGADGPANLLAAARVAVSPVARDLGVLVALGDEIHAGRLVHKAHASRPAAFASPGAGVLGTVTEGDVRLLLRPAYERIVVPTARARAEARPEVVVLPVGMGQSPMTVEVLESLAAQGAVDGVVVDGMGGGHVPRALVAPLERLTQRVPVLLTARTGAGAALSHSYGYPGGDVDLVGRGLVPAGELTAVKARLALMMALAAWDDRESVETWVRETFTRPAGTGRR